MALPQRSGVPPPSRQLWCVSQMLQVGGVCSLASRSDNFWMLQHGLGFRACGHWLLACDLASAYQGRAGIRWLGIWLGHCRPLGSKQRWRPLACQYSRCSASVDISHMSGLWPGAQVEYRERAAAGRRIPGNFLRREMGPSTQEAHIGHILTAAFAPLFPSGFDAPLQVEHHNASSLNWNGHFWRCQSLQEMMNRAATRGHA